MKTITYKPRKSGKTHAHNQIINAQLRDMVNKIPIKLHVVKRPNDKDIDRLKHIIYEAKTHNERYQLPLTNNIDLIYQDTVDLIHQDTVNILPYDRPKPLLQDEPLLQDVDYIKMREEWEDKTKEAINKGYQFHLSVDPYIADAEPMVFKSLIDNSSNDYNVIKYPVNNTEYVHLYTTQTCTRTPDVIIDVKPNNWFYKLMNKLFNLE